LLFDSAKKGPSTMIWVGCERMAASLRPAWAGASTTVVITSSSTTNGTSSRSPSPSNGEASPSASIASIPALTTERGMAFQ